MTKLITVKRAEAEIVRLQHYLYLVESYVDDTLEKKVIKEYAITNSMIEVIDNLRDQGYSVNKEFVVTVIKSKGNDELHRLIRTGYMKRTKPSRHY